MKQRRSGRRAAPVEPLDQLLTKVEAAERLNVSPRFVERCVAERRIRFVRVGRFIRVPQSAITELLEAGTVVPFDPVARRSVRR